MSEKSTGTGSGTARSPPSAACGGGCIDLPSPACGEGSGGGSVSTPPSTPVQQSGRTRLTKVAVGARGPQQTPANNLLLAPPTAVGAAWGWGLRAPVRGT